MPHSQSYDEFEFSTREFRVRNLNVRCFNGYFSLAELIILSDQSAKKQFRSSSFNFQFRSNSPWPLSSSPQYVKQSTVDYRRPPFILVLNIYEYSISKNISNADLYLRTICAPVVKLSLKISTEHQCSQNYISSVSNRLRQHASKIG